MNEEQQQFEELIVFSSNFSNSVTLFHSNIHQPPGNSRQSKTNFYGRTQKQENWQVDNWAIKEKARRNDELESLVRRLEEENRILKMEVQKMRQDSYYLTIKGVKFSKMILDLLSQLKRKDSTIDMHRKAEAERQEKQQTSANQSVPLGSLFPQLISSIPKKDIEFRSNRNAVSLEDGSFNLKILEQLLKVDEKGATSIESLIEDHLIKYGIELKGMGVDQEKLFDIINAEKERLVDIVVNVNVQV